MSHTRSKDGQGPPAPSLTQYLSQAIFPSQKGRVMALGTLCLLALGGTGEVGLPTPFLGGRGLPSPNPLAQLSETLRGWVGPEPQSLEGWEQPVRLGCAERVGQRGVWRGPGQKNGVMEASTGRTLSDGELEAGLRKRQRRDRKPFCQGTSQIGGWGVGRVGHAENSIRWDRRLSGLG